MATEFYILAQTFLSARVRCTNFSKYLTQHWQMVVIDDAADGGEHEVGDDEHLCQEYGMFSQTAIDDTTVLFDRVSPNDVVQGELGDCWLLSSFAAIAEWPDFVAQLVEDHGDETYLVHLHSFAEGKVKTYGVNDAFPQNGNMWIGWELSYVNASNKSEIWTCVLEKAFAKMAGGYQYLDGSFSWWAFAALTGCMDVEMIEQDDDDGSWKVYPLTIPDSDNPQDLNESQWWADDPVEVLDNQGMIEKLEEYNNSCYLMCVASNAAEGMSDQEKMENKIHYGHAYTLLKVANCPAGTDFHLLKLRNPWGSKEFKGPWSDGAPEWQEHPEVAQALKYKDKKDGMFWMGLDDFDSSYHQIFICKKDMREPPHTDVAGQEGGVVSRDITLNKQQKSGGPLACCSFG